MLLTVILALALVLLTSVLHFAVLRWLSGGMAEIPMRPGLRIQIIIGAALAAHLVEVGLYAVAYMLAVGQFGLGGFGGEPVASALDYYYFSIASYTSLGIGDVYPLGHIRFIAGVEALNGLLLIAWSGSFVYIAMGRLWPWRRTAEPVRREGGTGL